MNDINVLWGFTKKQPDPAQVEKALNNAAARDMRIAREQGIVIICQTKRGTVELTYDRSEKRYKLTTWAKYNHDPETIRENATASETRDELKKLYVVVE